MSGSRPSAKETPATLFGALLMAVGGLMVVLCGVCSLAVAGGYLYAFIDGSAMSVGERIGLAAGGLTTVATFGGVPILIGVLIFFAGRRMRRGDLPQAGRDPDRRK